MTCRRKRRRSQKGLLWRKASGCFSERPYVVPCLSVKISLSYWYKFRHRFFPHCLFCSAFSAVLPSTQPFVCRFQNRFVSIHLTGNTISPLGPVASCGDPVGEYDESSVPGADGPGTGRRATFVISGGGLKNLAIRF